MSERKPAKALEGTKQAVAEVVGASGLVSGQSNCGSTEEPVLLGQINGVFGVRGWLKVFSDTEPRENIVQYKKWLIARRVGRVAGVARKDGGVARQNSGAGSTGVTDDVEWKEVRLLEGKRHGKNVIVRLEGIDSREQAEVLVGYQVAVERQQLPKLPQGEYYWSDLIGLEVANTEGRVLGTVKRLFETGANDVLVVAGQGSLEDDNSVSETAAENPDERPPGKSSVAAAEILIPWVLDHFVLEVDKVGRRIIVDWQEDY